MQQFKVYAIDMTDSVPVDNATSAWYEGTFSAVDHRAAIRLASIERNIPGNYAVVAVPLV